MSDEKKEEQGTEEEKGEEAKEKWDADRQRADQERANYEKAAAERDAVKEELAEQQQKIKELQQQIKIEAAGKEVTLDELDPLTADVPDVIKQNKKLMEQLESTTKTVAKLETYAETLKQERERELAKQNKDKTIEKMLIPLDKEFGAKFRNPARELAEKLVDSGKEKKPKDAIDAMVLMRKCYKEVSESKSSKKETVPTDAGIGGAKPPAARKSGKLQDVLADMKTDRSWKE